MERGRDGEGRGGEREELREGGTERGRDREGGWREGGVERGRDGEREELREGGTERGRDGEGEGSKPSVQLLGRVRTWIMNHL